MSEESLIADQEQGAQKAQEAKEQQKPAEHAWFWNEGAQGEGDPPEWFKADKYKSVADQAAAYPEVEKKLGAFKGAPENYDLALPEDLEIPEGVEAKLDENDPLLETFAGWAKENDLSQDAFTDILGMYVKAQAKDYADTLTSAAEEKQALGPNSDKRLSDVATWGRNNMDEELFAKFEDMLVTAGSVEVAEYFIQKAQKVPLPDPNNINPNLQASMIQELKELEAEKDENGKLKWLADPNHRARINSLRNKIYGQGEHREVVG